MQQLRVSKNQAKNPTQTYFEMENKSKHPRVFLHLPVRNSWI